MDTTSPEGEQLGVDLLLVTQVARLPGVRVHRTTVQRWITKKNFPAQKATEEQIKHLFQSGQLLNRPPDGVYLIRKEDLPLIPKYRAYPKNTTRSKRGKKTGADTPKEKP